MDALIVLIAALVILLIKHEDVDNSPDSAIVQQYIEQSKTLETRLNPNFYEDHDAFMDIAHALGFHNGQET